MPRCSPTAEINLLTLDSLFLLTIALAYFVLLVPTVTHALTYFPIHFSRLVLTNLNLIQLFMNV